MIYLLILNELFLYLVQHGGNKHTISNGAKARNTIILTLRLLRLRASAPLGLNSVQVRSVLTFDF